MTRHLIIIGAQRSGTTYLSRMLDLHPEITMARPARPEPKVFLSAEQADLGRDWYLATYFQHAESEPVLGEKSTSYIERPDAAGRIGSMLGEDVTIVALLRDPIARAVSNWQFSSENGLEQRPLEVALAENLESGQQWAPGQTSVSPFAYLERGRYERYLAPWWDRFHARVHVLFFDEVMAGGTHLVKLYAALGVDTTFVPGELGARVNSSATPAPGLPPELVARLRAYFADSDAALRERLQRSLPWDEDRVVLGSGQSHRRERR